MKNIKTNLDKIAAYFILGVWGLLTVCILGWTVITSFKPNSEIFTNPFGFPQKLDVIRNYTTAWNVVKMGEYFRNSIFSVVLAVLINVMASSLAAYALTRFRFKLRSSLIVFFTLGMSLPIQLAMVPMYQIFRSLNLTGNLHGLSIVYVVINLSFNILLLTGFYRNLPHEIEESAIIDGCGELRLFYQIMFPLAQPGLITTATLMFVGCWNEYLMALVFVGTKPTLRTISLGMYSLRTSLTYSDYGSFFASIVIMLIPALLVFTLLQKYIISGLTLGSVKG